MNYGFAYRQGTWIPVDVLIDNEKEDFTGWVEVRTYDGDSVESPIYRLPAECAKGSRKRFQFHCFLGRTTSVETRLFAGSRELLDFPMRIDVKPIESTDLLGLVLDEDGSAFGFLNEAVNLGGTGDRRFFRESLPTEGLAFLAKYPQCYVPFDVVVFGNVDPNRVPARQRELLIEYVRSGGRIVVCTGEYAPKYRGTWIEDLLGAGIGAPETLNEQALAEAVFDSSDQQGAKGFRDCIVAPLTPAYPEVKRCGTNKVLATRRPMGSGFVYGVAIDADSHALQNCTGYLKLWRDIAVRRDSGNRLNYDSGAQFAATMLPRISGIVIHSKQSVIIYLVLYFCVGIVANWLFFSWLKRREWAWMTLVVFAFGFTAYAVVYGTAGRTGSSELQQIEVLHVPKDGGLSYLRSAIGLLNARTRTHSLTLGDEYALAQGLMDPFMQSVRRQQRGAMGTEARPFYLIEEEPPRIEDFRVGASELRLLQVETSVPVPGGVDGEVRLMEGGSLDVNLANKTGYTLKRPFLYLDGQMLSFTQDLRMGEHFSGQIGGYRTPEPDGNLRPGSGFAARGFRQYDAQTKAELARFRQDFPSMLFAESGFQPYSGATRLDTRLGPFLCGWVEDPQFGIVQPEQAARESIHETLLVADIALARGDQSVRTWETVPAWVDTSVSAARLGWENDQAAFTLRFRCNQTPTVWVFLDDEVLARDPSEIAIRLTVNSLHNHDIVFVPEGASEPWPETQLGPQGLQMQGRGNSVSFRSERWREATKDWDDAAFARAWEDCRVHLLQMQAASRNMQMQTGARGAPYDGPQPPDSTAHPAKVLVGHLQIAPGEPPCQRANDQANEVGLTARIGLERNRTKIGEDTTWR